MKKPPEVLPPAAIVAERDWLIGRPYFKEWHQPVLDRLCRASIWKQLNKHSPVIARQQLIELWTAHGRSEVPDEKWSDREVALQLAFGESFFLVALSDAQTVTNAKLRQASEFFLERAERLRNEAAFLLERMGEDSEGKAPDHVDAINRAAAWCEAQAWEYDFPDDSWPHPDLIVGRHQILPHVRAYCMLLAKTMRFLYGADLRGIVANIATAALDQQVSAANVRHWCENKDTRLR